MASTEKNAASEGELRSSSRFDKRSVGSFFFHRAARVAQFEGSLAQFMRSLRVLPGEEWEQSFRFDRGNQWQPCRATNHQGALTKSRSV